MRMKALICSLLLAGAAQAEVWKGTLVKSNQYSTDNQQGDFVALAEDRLNMTINLRWVGSKPKVKGFRCKVAALESGEVVKCKDRDQFGKCLEKRSLYVPLRSPGLGMLASELACLKPRVTRTVIWFGLLRKS